MDFVFNPPQKVGQKHRFIRQLYGLYKKLAQPLFVKTIQRALTYRITNVESLEQMAAQLLKEGNYAMPPAAVDEELLKKIKYIRLNGLADNLDNYLRIAQKNNFSHFRLLQYIIEEEYKLKQENSRKMRMSRAKIPEKYVMETFPFMQQPKLDKKKLLNLYDSFDNGGNGRNIIWMGPTGVGKTGLATAFLIRAITRGRSGRFISFPELIEGLYQSI